MCLTPTNTIKIFGKRFIKIQKAKQNISVYKILEKKTFLSPFLYHPYKEGKNYPIKPDRCLLKKEHHIKDGWLHAYRVKPEINTDKYICIEMIIPKGSRYIEGMFDICASCLQW